MLKFFNHTLVLYYVCNSPQFILKMFWITYENNPDKSFDFFDIFD